MICTVGFNNDDNIRSIHHFFLLSLLSYLCFFLLKQLRRAEGYRNVLSLLSVDRACDWAEGLRQSSSADNRTHGGEAIKAIDKQMRRRNLYGSPGPRRQHYGNACTTGLLRRAASRLRQSHPIGSFPDNNKYNSNDYPLD